MANFAGESRERLLRAAGLIPLGVIPSAAGITPEEAWKAVIRGDVVPTAVVDDDVENNLEEVNSQWWRLANSNRILAEDGSFLISVGNEGPSLPWAVVRGAPDVRLAQTLAPYPGEPEFVTMARDGHAVLGVTSEEDSTWLIVADLTSEHPEPSKPSA